MALQNPNTNEYLKVYDVKIQSSRNNVMIDCINFKDSEQRQRYDSGLSEYETVKNIRLNAEIFLSFFTDVLANNTKSVKDNLISQAYNAIKSDGNFSDWDDV